MKVLVACEESQRVCISFREKGHEAYSCDIIAPSGGHPEWHVQDDVLKILNWEDQENNCGGIWFATMDGKFHDIQKWDLIIAHPPCTFLTVTGNRWFNENRYGDKAKRRKIEREKAADFFMKFVNADCERIVIENPIGYMSTYYRKPDQIIQPYEYGEPTRKATCLWLKGVEKLKPTNIVKPEIIRYKNGKGTDSVWHMNTMNLPPNERAKERSKTFWGIAAAMADQWGTFLENHKI